MAERGPRSITPEEATLLDEAREYCRVKTSGNQKLAHPWHRLRKAYSALIRKENRDAGVKPRTRLRRVA